jgi:hypothetical protein
MAIERKQLRRPMTKAVSAVRGNSCATITADMGDNPTKNAVSHSVA